MEKRPMKRSNSRDDKGGREHGGGKDAKGKGKDARPRRVLRTPRIQIDLPEVIDYKDIVLLKKFLTDRGKLMPRRFTGVSARNQRLVAVAIKRARFLGLLSSGSAKRK